MNKTRLKIIKSWRESFTNQPHNSVPLWAPHTSLQGPYFHSFPEGKEDGGLGEYSTGLG